MSSNPDHFPDWRVDAGRVYFHRPSPLYDGLVPDLDAWKQVIPKEGRPGILEKSHNSPQAGHLGLDKTYRRFAQYYYWPRMLQEVTRFVGRCDTCQDLYTKWMEICPLRKAAGKTIRKALEELVINRWGAPRTFLTDNSTEFVNRELRALSEETGARLQTTPPYLPQTNQVERVNRVLKTMLRAFLEGDHRDWDVHLHEFRFAYNMSHHGSINMTKATTLESR